MGGYSDSFRDDVYRVDREKARLYFFRGEEMPPPKRSKYQPSHKVFIREPIISFQLYDTILCQRNLVNGTLWFNHGGWITKETMKDLHPLFAEYFGGNLHLVRKNNCLYLLDPRYGYSRIEKTAMEVTGISGLWMTPVGVGVWEANNGKEKRRFDFVARKLG